MLGRRQIAGVLTALLLLLVAVACSDDGNDDDGGGAGDPSAASEESAELPDTPAGRQLGWLVEVSQDGGELSQSEYAEHFAAGFRQQVGREEVTAGLEDELTVVELLPGQTPHYLTTRVEQSSGELVASVQVDPGDDTHPIVAATLTPTPSPTPPDDPGLRTWNAVDTAVTDLAPRVGLSVAQIGDDGSCDPVHELAADSPQPLASTIKLWVLGALAEHVRSGEVAWDDEIAVDAALQTVPSGVLQDEPADTTITVLDTAALMISISDNTATDHLIELVGRDAVEAQLERFEMADPSAIRPLPAMGDMAALELVDYPRLADEWRGADEAGRRALLDDPRLSDARPTADGTGTDTTDDIAAWSDPRWTGLAWMGSPNDLCRALAGLHALARQPGLEPLDEIMGLDDGGLGLAPEIWTGTWFKGGSEPGVSTAAYIARHHDGQTYAVTAALADEDAPLDAETTVRWLDALRAAFALAPP